MPNNNVPLPKKITEGILKKASINSKPITPRPEKPPSGQSVPVAPSEKKSK